MNKRQRKKQAKKTYEKRLFLSLRALWQEMHSWHRVGELPITYLTRTYDEQERETLDDLNNKNRKETPDNGDRTSH